MEKNEVEMAQLTIILRDEHAVDNREALKQLQAGGLQVTNVDNDDGVVEGTVEAGKVAELKKLPCVETIRTDETWIAEYPGDQKSGDDADPEEPEDWK